MLYGALRLILCAILFGAIFFLRKLTKRPISKRFVIILLIGLWILQTGLGFLPFENYFFSFPTPEACFSYTNQEEPDYILEGEHSSFVIAINHSKYIFRMIGKGDSGWKIAPPGQTYTSPESIPSPYIVWLYQYKDTTDHYIIIFHASGEKLDVSDSNHSTFIEHESEGLDGSDYEYFGFIGNISDGYTLSINGEIITLK